MCQPSSQMSFKLSNVKQEVKCQSSCQMSINKNQLAVGVKQGRTMTHGYSKCRALCAHVLDPLNMLPDILVRMEHIKNFDAASLVCSTWLSTCRGGVVERSYMNACSQCYIKSILSSCYRLRCWVNCLFFGRQHPYLIRCWRSLSIIQGFRWNGISEYRVCWTGGWQWEGHTCQCQHSKEMQPYSVVSVVCLPCIWLCIVVI